MNRTWCLTFSIGGVDQQVTEAILHAAFIPFGEIVAVQLSPDASRCKYILNSILQLIAPCIY